MSDEEPGRKRKLAHEIKVSHPSVICEPQIRFQIHIDLEELTNDNPSPKPHGSNECMKRSERVEGIWHLTIEVPDCRL